MKEFVCTLPVPPSANTLFPTNRHSGGRFPSKRYAAWRSEANIHFYADTEGKLKPRMSGSLKASYIFSFTDNRKRDIANFEKAVTDFLVTKGIIDDDHMIDEMCLYRSKDTKTGLVYIKIEYL